MDNSTKPSLLTLLLARRDELTAQHDALLKAGDRFAAEDMAIDLEFANACAYDALMGRC